MLLFFKWHWLCYIRVHPLDSSTTNVTHHPSWFKGRAFFCPLSTCFSRRIYKRYWFMKLFKKRSKIHLQRLKLNFMKIEVEYHQFKIKGFMVWMSRDVWGSLDLALRNLLWKSLNLEGCDGYIGQRMRSLLKAVPIKAVPSCLTCFLLVLLNGCVHFTCFFLLWQKETILKG